MVLYNVLLYDNNDVQFEKTQQQKTQTIGFIALALDHVRVTSASKWVCGTVGQTRRIWVSGRRN